MTDSAKILVFVENYQKVYGEHPYSVELERNIRFNEPKPDVKKVIMLMNDYKHKYGIDDYLVETVEYFNLDFDEYCNIVEKVIYKTMSIDDVIKQLQELKAENGDIPVVLSSDCECNSYSTMHKCSFMVSDGVLVLIPYEEYIDINNVEKDNV